VALAGGALLAALVVDARATARAALSPLALTLTALGGYWNVPPGLLSAGRAATWRIARAARSVR